MTRPIRTACHNKIVKTPVLRACAALDWMCATSAGSEEFWQLRTPNYRLTLDRHTRTGPPDRFRYLAHRRLLGRVREARSIPARVELELYPWDSGRTEVVLRPRRGREDVSQILAHALGALSFRIIDVLDHHDDDELDTAALRLLLSGPTPQLRLSHGAHR